MHQCRVKYFNSLSAAARFEMTGLERMAFNSIRIDAPALLFCMAVVCRVLSWWAPGSW